MSCSAYDTLLRVESIFYIEHLCSIFSKHHQAAHSCKTFGFRIPMRLLVGDTCKKSPWKTKACSCLFEILFKLWESTSETSIKHLCIVVIKKEDIRVVMVFKLYHLSFLIKGVQPFVHICFKLLRIFW